MSCCNFGNRRYGHMRDFNRFDDRFDNRRGCCNVNWGSCRRDSRICPRRGPSRPGFRRPY